MTADRSKTTHITSEPSVVGDDGRAYKLSRGRPELSHMYTRTYIAYDEREHCYEVEVSPEGYDAAPVKVVKHIDFLDGCMACEKSR